jgi:uncharacterized membrane protein
MTKALIKTSLVFSIIGVLFSGYLTFTKLVLGVCPLRESCPFLWSYPVCLYGLIMFFTALVASIALLCVHANDRFAFEVLRIISAVGVLFSLYYVYQEIFVIKCVGGCVYSLGIPTCIYGFFMFLVIHLSASFYGRKTFRKLNTF